jgi:hypothetical protein
MLIPSHSTHDLCSQYYSINLIVKRICFSAFLLTDVVFPILSRRTREVWVSSKAIGYVVSTVASNSSPRHSSLPIPNRSFVTANVPNTHRSKPNTNTNERKEKNFSNQKEESKVILGFQRALKPSAPPTQLSGPGSPAKNSHRPEDKPRRRSARPGKAAPTRDPPGD